MALLFWKKTNPVVLVCSCSMPERTFNVLTLRCNRVSLTQHTHTDCWQETYGAVLNPNEKWCSDLLSSPEWRPDAEETTIAHLLLGHRRDWPHGASVVKGASIFSLDCSLPIPLWCHLSRTDKYIWLTFICIYFEQFLYLKYIYFLLLTHLNRLSEFTERTIIFDFYLST